MIGTLLRCLPLRLPPCHLIYARDALCRQGLPVFRVNLKHGWFMVTSFRHAENTFLLPLSTFIFSTPVDLLTPNKRHPSDSATGQWVSLKLLELQVYMRYQASEVMSFATGIDSRDISVRSLRRLINTQGVSTVEKL